MHNLPSIHAISLLAAFILVIYTLHVDASQNTLKKLGASDGKKEANINLRVARSGSADSLPLHTQSQHQKISKKEKEKSSKALEIDPEESEDVLAVSPRLSQKPSSTRAMLKEGSPMLVDQLRRGSTSKSSSPAVSVNSPEGSPMIVDELPSRSTTSKSSSPTASGSNSREGSPMIEQDWMTETMTPGSAYQLAITFKNNNIQPIVNSPTMAPIPIWTSFPRIMTAFKLIRDGEYLKPKPTDDTKHCRAKEMVSQGRTRMKVSWENDGKCFARASAVQNVLLKAGLVRKPPSVTYDPVQEAKSGGLPIMPANVFSFPIHQDPAKAAGLMFLTEDSPEPQFWVYHVAPIVRYDFVDGSMPLYLVLDPLTNPSYPTPLESWLKRQVGAGHVAVCSPASTSPHAPCLDDVGMVAMLLMKERAASGLGGSVKEVDPTEFLSKRDSLDNTFNVPQSPEELKKAKFALQREQADVLSELTHYESTYQQRYQSLASRSRLCAANWQLAVIQDKKQPLTELKIRALDPEVEVYKELLGPIASLMFGTTYKVVSAEKAKGEPGKWVFVFATEQQQ